MKRMNFRQSALTYLIGISCFSAFLLPDTVSRYAGSASLPVFLLSAFFSLLPGTLFEKILHRYGSFFNFVKKKCGLRVAACGGVLAAIILSITAVFYACAFYERLASTAFSYIPKWVCAAVPVLCALLVASQEQKALRRSVQIVFIILMLCFVALSVFSFKSIDVKSLLPVKVKSITSLAAAFLFPLGLPGLFVLLFYHSDFKIIPKNGVNVIFVAGSMIGAGIVFLTQSVFGTVLSEKISYPFFALIKSTDSFVGFEHFESLVSGIWILVSLCFFCTLFGAVFENSSGILKKEKAKSIFSLILGCVIFAGALCVPHNRFLSETVLSTILPFCTLILGIFVPSILTLTKRHN